MFPKSNQSNSYRRLSSWRKRHRSRAAWMAGVLFAFALQSIPAQTTSSSQQKRIVTLSERVPIFLQQNLDLIAARYDVDSVDAEKISAAVRPNPAIEVESEGLPIAFNGPILAGQTFTYTLSQDFELGRKRAKRINAANANSELARAQFQTAVWQLTNDVKKKFYAVLLAESL